MSFDGVWNCVLKTPMGPQQVTLTLQSQNGQLSGTMSGSGLSAPVEGGRCEGNKATWVAKLTQPMAITIDFNANVADNALTGKAKFGMFGSGELTGTRA